MPILKAKRKGYVSMDREFLIRKDLSLKAKGLLAQMMTLPNTWRFTIDGLVHCHKESKTAISASLKELEQLGYLRREHGRIDYVEYTVCDIPLHKYETLVVDWSDSYAQKGE
jgi:DNA-binding MarR family transcriptional regulator